MPKFRYVCAVTLLLMVIIYPLILSVFCQSSGEYTYYGYVPSRIYQLHTTEEGWIPGYPGTWKVVEGSISTHGLLVSIGNYEDTGVKIFELPGGVPIEEFTLNRLEKKITYLGNGTFFKVSSNKPVTLIIFGGGKLEKTFNTLVGSINTFYVSSDGGYVGKEFVFMAIQASIGVLAYHVFALEESDIAVFDKNGSTVYSFNLKANQAKSMAFVPGAVYQLVSSGNVVLQGGILENEVYGLCAYPSIEGGFLGKTFYGNGYHYISRHGETVETQLLAGAVNAAKIDVFVLKERQKYSSLNVPASSNISISTPTPHIVVKSDNPMTLLYVIHGYRGAQINGDTPGGGVTYMGLKAGQEAYIYVPYELAYIFSYKNTQVTVDSATYNLLRDAILPLSQGLHKISTTENIIINLIAYPRWPEAIQGLTEFGACVPSVQSLSLSYELELKPVVVEGFPWSYIAIPVAIAAIIVVIFIRRKRM